jgi:site-specific DNA-methyltransferase (adenine-specific)
MKPYYQHNGITIYHGDCLEVMPLLEPASFDAIICDPPYGSTACAWDSPIPFAPMWANIRRLAKPRAAVALFGGQPFTSALVMSNPTWYRHEWIWQKNRGSNFTNTVREPMKEHESVLLFSEGGWTYNPQMQERAASGLSRVQYSIESYTNSDNYGKMKPGRVMRPEDRLPSSVQKFNTQVGLHPTQKPLALMEYLIRTYTNEGDLILDFTSGSGTTGRAAKNLKRRAVLIEKELGYCAATVKRLEPAFEAALIDNGAALDDLPLFAMEAL